MYLKQTLRSERMLLRLPELSDIQQIISFYEKNVSFLAPWEPEKPTDFYTVPYWKERILFQRELYHKGQNASFLLFLTQEGKEEQLIGMLGLSEVIRGPLLQAFLGYKIDQEYCSKGLATEAIKTVLPFAFHEFGLHRISANYRPENIASGKVLEKCGFEKEGLAKNYLKINGQWCDHILTALTQEAFLLNETKYK